MDRYCVIGNPIAHSKSPEIHAAFALQTGQALSYERCLAPLAGFAVCVHDLIAQGYLGANVTVPFKLDAFALAGSLSERARAAGAVNTLRFIDGAIHADNTDGAGLVRDIVHNARQPIAGRRVLLLGAGGASRGVLLPLLQQGPAELVIANRTRAGADALVQQFAHAAELAGVTLYAGEFAELSTPFDLIINATSASLHGAVPALADGAIVAGTLALDMMYGPAPTVFMQFAAQRGARVRDGLGMLVEQAGESFYLWRGVRPDTTTTLAQLRAQL